MRKKLVRNWAIIFSLLFVVCFMIMGFYYLLFNNIDSFNFKNKKIEIDKETYNMEIEIPVYTKGALNKDVDVLVDNVKASFINSNDDLNRLEMNYSYSIYGDIYSFHYKSLSFKDDDSFVSRDDYFKYYDSKKNKELSIDDLISRDEEYLIKLKYIIDNYLKDNKNVKINENDYDNFIFSDDKIYLVVPNGEKDINVPIDYLDLKIFLNEDYFDIDGEYVGVPQEVKEEQVEEKVETKVEEKVEEPKKETTKKTTTPKKEQPKEELKSNNDGSQNKITPVVRDASYFEGKKLICFTFDDGPGGANTTKLLDALKERNFKVTFFLVGNRVKKQSALVQRMKNEGHSIGQHSWSHKNLKKLDENAAKNEIYLANDVIQEVIGENPRYIRPPYGAYNTQVLSYADMVFVNWSIDPLDWKYKNAETVYNNIISKAYDGAVVLVHDIHATSVDGAIKAMDYLAANGYAIVSIDEMAQLRGMELQTHHLYNNFKK